MGFGVWRFRVWGFRFQGFGPEFGLKEDMMPQMSTAWHLQCRRVSESLL